VDEAHPLGWRPLQLARLAAMSHPSIRQHHHPLSGHVHRVELFLSLLAACRSRNRTSISPRAEHKSAEFLAINPFGQLPVIEDGGHVIRRQQRDPRATSH
jgi:hypothetical protein